MMNVYSSYESGKLNLFLQGELDQHGIRGSVESIESLLDEYLPRECVLDLSSLSFMDSSGIALMLKLLRRMQREGGSFWVENAAAQPLRVLEASGIERLMHLTLTKEG